MVINQVQNVLGYHILEVSRHPVEFLYIRVASALLRDTLISGGPYDVEHQFMLSFVPHDFAVSCRNSPFTMEGWIMFLDFPLDFKTPAIIDKAVSLFGKVIKAQLDDNVRGKLMVKALYSSTLQVPRRIVIKRVTAFDGVGRSWTVSVFLCDEDLPDVMPTDEDLPPVNHISIPEPVPQVQPEVEFFRDNMQEDAHEDQLHQSHTISALSVVAAGSHQVTLHNQGTPSLELIVQPRFLANPLFWRMLSSLNVALRAWENSFSPNLEPAAFRLLPFSSQWYLAMGPPQNLQIVSYSLPVVQVIQFALQAAVLLLAGHDDVERGYGSMGPSS